jgi:hypothetical protein
MQLTDTVNGWGQSTLFEMDTVTGTNRDFAMVFTLEAIDGDIATMMTIDWHRRIYGE